MAYKIIVFGGAGFLGSHIADALSDSGHEVTIFDRAPSCFIRKNQKQIVGDILDEGKVREALQGQEIIYHLAGIADIDECHKKPIDAVKMNILGTTQILHHAVEAKVQKIIFASSAYVYSDSGTFYRITKQACEQLVETYQKEFGLDFVILRYGSLYGSRSDYRNSIYRLLTEALRSGNINYGGTGEETREFIHVEDAARLSVQILNHEFKNQNIILTGPTTIRYRDLLEMIQEIMRGEVKINYVEKSSSTHYRLSPYSFSPKLGRKLVNNPHIDLGQGLLNLLGEIHHDLHAELEEKNGILIKGK
jgi:UDP-glucose 4-epimerase